MYGVVHEAAGETEFHYNWTLAKVVSVDPIKVHWFHQGKTRKWEPEMLKPANNKGQGKGTGKGKPVPFVQEVNIDNILSCRVSLKHKMLERDSEISLRRLYGTWWETNVTPFRENRGCPKEKGGERGEVGRGREVERRRE